MDAIARRRLIASRSPITQQVDPRPRCEDCGSVLVQRDFHAYWEGEDPYTTGCLPKGADPTPRCCERCAEGMDLKSV